LMVMVRDAGTLSLNVDQSVDDNAPLAVDDAVGMFNVIVPDVVIGDPDTLIFDPAEPTVMSTLVTVPLPLAATNCATLSIPFCTLALVAVLAVSTFIVPLLVIVPPVSPDPAVTLVTVPPPALEIKSARLSPTFCSLDLVDIVDVSTFTVPLVVMVPKLIPVPAATLNTVPPPEDDIRFTRLSIPFCTLDLVDSNAVSAFNVPVDVIVPPVIPVDVAIDVTVPPPPTAGSAAFLIVPSTSEYNIFMAVVVESIVRTLALPFTSSTCVGASVPTPTFPFALATSLYDPL